MMNAQLAQDLAAAVAELAGVIARRLGGSLDDVMRSLADLRPMFEEAKLFSNA